MTFAEKGFLGVHRAALLAPARGRLLEVGCGTGLNFPRYPRGAHIVAVEPDPHMLSRAVARADTSGLHIALVEADGEHLPFAEGAFDSVVVTLVLCTVSDPVRAVTEIRRVLRAGGELRLLEHVRASSPGWARLQDCATPLWRRIGAGCHPNRDTLAALERAGFRIAELERFAKGPYPVRQFVRAVAVRP